MAKGDDDMLKLYASTVVIWGLVLWASARIAEPYTRRNGWLNDDGGDRGDDIPLPFVVALVPVFRLAVLVGIWRMAFNKKQP